MASYTRLELNVCYENGHSYMLFLPLTNEQAKVVEQCMRERSHLDLELSYNAKGEDNAHEEQQRQ
jgi:hypothetical protein